MKDKQTRHEITSGYSLGWYGNFANYVCDNDYLIYDKACKWADSIEEDERLYKISKAQEAINKLHWFETFKIDANIKDEILEDINKIIKRTK
jgi:hypothetical protein